MANVEKTNPIRDMLESVKFQFAQNREKTEQMYDSLTSGDPVVSLELTERQRGDFTGRIITWDAAVSIIEQIEAKL